MPGTLTIDITTTFQAALLMASGPKLKFGSTEQDISARGERKWACRPPSRTTPSPA